MEGKYKVKIINGNNSLTWYYDQVGAVLFVEYYSSKYFFLKIFETMYYLRKEDCEILEKPEPEKIPFSWEAYQTGKYNVVTRDGREINEIYRFNTIAENDNKGEYAQIYAAIEKNVYSYFNNGRYKWFGESDRDLFLIEKQ